MAIKLQLFKSKEKQSAVVQISFIVIVIIYMLIGSAVFILIEGSQPVHVKAKPPKWNEYQSACFQRVYHNQSLTDDQKVDQLIRCANYRPPRANTWADFSTALMFTFTVVTTIGYGHVAPNTTLGRVFCVVYGLVGIPLAMMTVANIGKFLMENAKKLAGKAQKFSLSSLSPMRLLRCFLRARLRHGESRHKLTGREEDERKQLDENGIGNAGNLLVDMSDRTAIEDTESMKTEKLDEPETPDEEVELSGSTAGIIILVAFSVYIFAGSVLLPMYEEEMDFITALYFNFVTLTTVGLGDLVPTSTAFLWFTIIYVVVGLALTTMAIEIASEYLKKLHYYGRKLADPGAATIWFGGKKMTVKSLMKNLGEMYGIDELADMDNLVNLVDTAIDKDEHPENYVKEFDPDDDRSVKPKHLRQVKDPSSITYVDSEYSDDELNGIISML